MVHRVAFAFLLLPKALLTARHSFMRCDSKQPVSTADLKRNQGYALLYSTVNAESHEGRRLYSTTLADGPKALHDRDTAQTAAPYIAQTK